MVPTQISRRCLFSVLTGECGLEGGACGGHSYHMICVTGLMLPGELAGSRAPQWPLPTFFFKDLFIKEKLFSMLSQCLPAVGPGLPWDEPIMECEDYAHWVRGDLSCNIWHRIPAGALGIHGARGGAAMSPPPPSTHTITHTHIYVHTAPGHIPAHGLERVTRPYLLLGPGTFPCQQTMRCICYSLHHDDDARVTAQVCCGRC
jgi:hypothetical protein